MNSRRTKTGPSSKQNLMFVCCSNCDVLKKTLNSVANAHDNDESETNLVLRTLTTDSKLRLFLIPITGYFKRQIYFFFL